jgi:hypothetical protein
MHSPVTLLYLSCFHNAVRIYWMILIGYLEKNNFVLKAYHFLNLSIVYLLTVTEM